MKKIVILTSILLLSACTVVPVAPKFPDRPDELKTDCPNEVTLSTNPADNVQFSDMMVANTKNGALYALCKYKNEQWNSWYDQQKALYEKAISTKPVQK